MYNFRQILKKFKTPILLFFGLVIGFLILPWYSPTSVSVDSPEGSIHLILQSSNGFIRERTYDLKETGTSIPIVTQKVLSVATSDPKNSTHFDPQVSERFNPKIILSIFYSSFLLVCLFYYIKKLLQRGRAPYVLLTHLLLTCGLYIFGFPIIDSGDTYHYYYHFGHYDWTSFSGFFFGMFFWPIFQIAPSEWTLPAFICLLTSLCFYHFFAIARELKVVKYYIVSCILFYLIPSNVFQFLQPVRDFVATALFSVFLIELYLYFTKGGNSPYIKWYLTLGALVSIIGRPEVGYILPLCLIVLTFLFSRNDFKWALSLTAFVFAFNLIQPICYHFYKRTYESDVYHSTLLINPLSYILKRKYPNGLPSEIDQKLGPYFKTEYLIIYQNDHDIDPFHKGGVNYNRLETYKQFRNESFRIFLNNPNLFLENRMKIATSMFHFGELYSLIGGFVDGPPSTYVSKVRRAFSFEEITSPAPKISNALKDYLKLVDIYPRLLKFYFVPFLFFLNFVILLNRTSWFWKIFSIVVLRSLLVIAIAPAPYVKYNYPLWFFLVFAFPYVIWEKNRENTSV